MKNGPYKLVKPPAGYPGRLHVGRYAYEQHVVWWVNTGSMPRPGFILKHKNQDRSDNRFENLYEMPRIEHLLSCLGAVDRTRRIKFKCHHCGSEFEKVHSKKAKAQLETSGLFHFCTLTCIAESGFTDKDIGAYRNVVRMYCCKCNSYKDIAYANYKYRVKMGQKAFYCSKRCQGNARAY